MREQIKWLCLFFTKDRDSFEDCLRENDVIPDKNERDRLKECLQNRFILNSFQSDISLLAIICHKICYNLLQSLLIFVN